MIDVDHRINAVRRTVGTTTLEAGEARMVTVSQTYATDLDDLWDACTSAERIPRWFLPVTGELAVGGRYQLEGNAGGEVLSCDPPKSFSATWEFGGDVSWITVRLVPESPDETRFELEHVARVDQEIWEQFGPGAVGIGWDLGFIGLFLHLEGGGATVDPAEVAAWTVSDEGRDFMRQSCDRWYEADVAAGADPEAARAAADRTIAAYTAVPDEAADPTADPSAEPG
jgi:uncharacterized protein YndB with AHSA1/START domain